MSEYSKLPIVTIVGRANVGKSSLYNALIRKFSAIVAYEPGTTRDSVYSVAEIDNQRFWLVDTAGLKNPDDDFELSIQDQIIEAGESSDLVIVVVSANNEISEEDRRLVKLAYKFKKPLILVINKIDQVKNPDDEIAKFAKLGIKNILVTSVKQTVGIKNLKQEILKNLPPNSNTKLDLNEPLKIALLGRPNVGKSSLFNSLAKKQQALVSAKSGTTRDINRVMVRYKDLDMEIMDTAGIRRPGRIEKGIEQFSVLRSLSAIDMADVCLVLIAADEPSVALDQKIAGMVKSAGKGLILVITKWDKINEEDKKAASDKILKQLTIDYEFVSWAPVIITSATSGLNVAKIFELAININTNRSQKIKTPLLNNLLSKAILQHPPAGQQNHNPKLNYIVQEQDNKNASFKIFGSQIKYIHWSYKRYLDRKIRESFDYTGVPIEIWYIEKHLAHKHGQKPTPKELT